MKEQLIQDYINKVTTQDIMKKYNISWKKMTKILKENGVYRKHNSISYSQEIIDYIKENYGKVSNLELAKTLNISEDNLVIRIKKLGIPLRGSGSKIRPEIGKIEWNSSILYYLMGWIASDGNISKNLHVTKLALKDEIIIDKFHNFFKFSKKVEAGRSSILHQLFFCSKEFSKKLVELGITPNKTKTLEVKTEILTREFIRGVFEGDGHIRSTLNSNKTKRYEAGIVTASEKFKNQLVGYLEKNNIKIYTSLENNSYYRIRISGKENLKLFYHFIYDNCENWFLPRKKQIFDRLYGNIQNESGELLENP